MKACRPKVFEDYRTRPLTKF